MTRGRHRVESYAAVAGALLCLTSVPSVVTDAAQAGAVRGTVRLESASTRRLATAGAYPSRHVSVSPPRASSELQNVVVYLRDGRPEPPRPTRAAVRQINEEFVPHLVAVGTGSVVEFPNDDLVFHNVFSLSSAATFDLGRYPRHSSKTRTFTKAGIVKVFCHLHSHMNAVVRVFDHPYFTTVGQDGRFVLSGLPPGPHRLAAWHERGGEATLSVVVGPGETSDVEFSLPVVDES